LFSEEFKRICEKSVNSLLQKWCGMPGNGSHALEFFEALRKKTFRQDITSLPLVMFMRVWKAKFTKEQLDKLNDGIEEEGGGEMVLQLAESAEDHSMADFKSTLHARTTDFLSASIVMLSSANHISGNYSLHLDRVLPASRML
jgi:hypothetical protein